MMQANKKVLLLISTAAVLTAAVCCIFLNPESESLIKEGTGQFSRIKQKDYAQLMFAGDLMFDRGIRYYAQKNGGNDFVFEKISAMLKAQDLIIANLEGPITDNKSISAGTAIGSKNNYFFTFDPSLAKTLFQENIRVVNLGNNHILNFGYEGLKATKKYLDNAYVDYFGEPGGSRSMSTEINGIKITLISYNEFSELTPDVEQESTINEIEKAENYSDIIIIFCHWGNEYQPEPASLQKVLAHQFVDVGADLIIGSHPHVIQPVEDYNGKRIYYSLGNFIFDQYFDENVRNGLGVIVKINKITKEIEFEEKKFYLENNGQTILSVEK